MRDYELVVLYHPDLEIDLDKALKKVEGLIKNSGGKVMFSDNWGKRKMAYTIKKQDYAIYVYYEIQLETAAIGKLEGLLNITDEVVRYLVSKPTPNFGDRDKPSNVEDVEEGSEEKEDKSPAKADDKKKPSEDKKEEVKEDKKEEKETKAKTTKTKDVKEAAEAKEE